MKLLKKLTSKKGQVSMEIGILVAAAVAVAAIAAYYYVSNVKSSAANSGAAAQTSSSKLANVATNYTDSLSNL
ncbi:conserved hypothetical protein [Methanococcus aeolicus Nankai-3]|uniref:Class III signal peptide-containing protein n=1 Tax=Methanococcus aeolicus (strain ATCC BAA-1280 / DSM 17508 / OCM 812 / Nankai-3) TaxID=419665 RepID=A6UUR0_META3|nr:class III signal peptide-containing protein [Methanococcus aeolicus]ABR56232.1 conserved hypothetical protein [Methanococcus aeolicus Nankai-3]